MQRAAPGRGTAATGAPACRRAAEQRRQTDMPPGIATHHLQARFLLRHGVPLRPLARVSEALPWMPAFLGSFDKGTREFGVHPG